MGRSLPLLRLMRIISENRDQLVLGEFILQQKHPGQASLTEKVKHGGRGSLEILKYRFDFYNDYLFFSGYLFFLKLIVLLYSVQFLTPRKTETIVLSF